jgi:hypothetical protein
MLQSAQTVASHHGGAGAVANMISTLWDSFSPEIARELEEQKLGENLPLFKKIIFIDKRIPPITVFDQTQAAVSQPISKFQKFKYVVERALYTIAGGVVAMLPQIIELCKGTSEGCDRVMLEKLILACNSSAT